MAPVFPPFADPQRFPVIASPTGDEHLLLTLMACDNLTALAPENIARADLIGRSAGLEWHEYGDTRWPSSCCWVEFPVTNFPRFHAAAVLIICNEVPASEAQPFEWIGRNHPLALVIPRFGATEQIEKFSLLLRAERSSTEFIAGPDDADPRYVQSYVLFGKDRTEQDIKEIAIYTDLLNQNGIPIAKFRTAEFKVKDIPWCRQTLSALFHLNCARLAGFPFVAHGQLQGFNPVRLKPDKIPPKWAAFHPCRTLRLRPAVRALPKPELVEGIIGIGALQELMNARRLEANKELLWFDREIRPRDLGLQGLDTNSSVTAFLHRANGAAIYVLPERLVEEFDKTDCSEVRMADLNLPFFSLFLKFNPPETIALSESALVDGCYLVKQENEILLTLTAKRPDVDYETSTALACLDPIFALHLPSGNSDTTINEAILVGIEDFRAKNAPPDEDLSEIVELPDGLKTELVDVRAESRQRRIKLFQSQEPAFRACLNIIVNAACFISFRPDDIEDAWEGVPSVELMRATTSVEKTRRATERRTAALRRIENGDFTRIKICGADLFADQSDRSNIKSGRSLRAHWRRGHWRRQRQGPSLAQIVLRWIRPTLVKKKAGSPVEARLYEVDDS